MTISPDILFRRIAMLAALVLGMQQFAMLAWVAPAGWPLLHLPVYALWREAIGAQGAVAMSQATYLLAPIVFVLACRQGFRGVVPACWLALQIALALVCNDKWLLLTATTLALALPLRAALAGLSLQLLAYLALYLAHAYLTRNALHLSCALLSVPGQLSPDERWATQWSDIAQMAVYQLLAFGVGCLGARERRSRQQLALTHAETLATQQLLADATRASERLRIARELHDAVGHQLTALHLHLDLAVRQASEQAGPMAAAREMAQRLLAEVRAIVSIERRERA